MAVDLLFFFDSEDYETPAADEGELWWANALSRHGLTGCFNLVGEEARALRDRGRNDVLRALARHEIGYHSNLHSAHPVHAEYLEAMGWEDGIAAVLAKEAAGVADVRELTGQHPSTYCKPGSNWAPQVLVAMSRLGIPTFCDSPFEWQPGHPLWYCGSLCVGYHTSFDRYFNVPAGNERKSRMRDDFSRLLGERRNDGGVLVMYSHPCRLITSAFPDNFSAGQNPPRSAWRPAPPRPREEVEELTSDFDDFLAWVAHSGEARMTSYRDLYESSRRNNLWLDSAMILEMAKCCGDGIEPRKVGNHWLSPAEQLGVVLWTAAWRYEHQALPEAAPVRPLLGPDLCAAPNHGGPIEVRSLYAACREASYQAGLTGRVPSVCRIGDRLLGPGALLRAISGALTGADDVVSLGEGSEMPELAGRADFAGLHFNKSWSILAPEFEAPRITQLAQLQTWSARPLD